MNTNYEAALALLRAALFGAPLTLPASVDWQAVYQELQQQAVACLPASILPDLPGLDDAFRQRWAMRTITSMQRFYHILQEQSDLLALLQSAGIKAVVLKGTAAAMYYPNPDYRSMGDVDVLVEDGRADEALRLMLQNDYELTKPAGQHKIHFNLNKNDVDFEIHRSFAVRLCDSAAVHLNACLFESIDKAEIHSIAGYTFPVLPQLQNGLVLLAHTNQHMKEGIGLRHVLDWVMYAAAVLDDTFWYSTFKEEAERIGLDKFAIALTRMAQLYFGLPTENRTWCQTAEKELCDRLLQYVLDSGNFGNKQADTKAISYNWNAIRGIKNTLKNLQIAGCINFRHVIEKYPFIKPFAWLLRIGRLLMLCIKQGVDIKTIRDTYEASRDRIALFEDLGLRMEYEND